MKTSSSRQSRRSRAKQVAALAKIAPVRVGCAGWTISRWNAEAFPADGSHLERYAALFSAVEINSSFYRSHRRKTYERWAAAVGDDFRFSVKMPKTITHEHSLHAVGEPLAEFLDEIGGLGEKLGCILVQLPASLKFDAPLVRRFFKSLRSRTTTAVVCEPRGGDWFQPAVDDLFDSFHVGRVIADPPCDPRGIAIRPESPLTYLRLHGSPRMYYSHYDAANLQIWSDLLLCAQATGQTAWCIFDNTAHGGAVPNAMEVVRRAAGFIPAVCDGRNGKYSGRRG